MVARRGEVWYVALDPVVGSEQGKTRPCVVVQRNIANETSSVTIVCPITSADRRKPSRLNVPIRKGEGGLSKSSIAICNQLRTVDYARFRGTMLGTLDERTMALVDDGLRAILDIE